MIPVGLRDKMGENQLKTDGQYDTMTADGPQDKTKADSLNDK